MGGRLAAIDYSSKKVTFYSIVGVCENVLKSRMMYRVKWLAHISRLPKYNKRRYLIKFPGRYQKHVFPFLILAKISKDLNRIVNYLYELKPDLLIIDDRIAPKIEYKSKIRESYAEKIKIYRVLQLIADNLAYYARELYENNPKQFRSKIQKLLKQQKGPNHGHP